MKKKRHPPARSRKLDADAFLVRMDGGRTEHEYQKGETVFSQGDPADSVFYLRRGKIKIAVTSEAGKEAVVALLGGGDFFGEGMPDRPAFAHCDGDRDDRLRSCAAREAGDDPVTA